MTETATLIARQIAQEIGAKPAQVVAAVDLLDGGATVPFVARYRKEATGGLDDTQLRTLSERLVYLREMEGRRASILEQITAQGKLTPALDSALRAATTKAQLEDLYLPYRPKRRTKATIARENGLEPLALAIQAQRALDPETLAQAYLGEVVPDTRAALDGAREIIAEGVMEDAPLRGQLRRLMQAHAMLAAAVEPGKEQEGAKFSDYFTHSEPWAKAPSHRVLAMLRGRSEGVLNLDLTLSEEAAAQAEGSVSAALGVGRAGPGDLWLGKAASWIWRIKLKLALTLDLMADLRERAEADAIAVFARNMKDLLLAAPAGQRAAMGLDPGIRTGVKVAVVDATGKVLDTATIYPFAPRFDVAGAKATLASLARKHGVELIAIGNGTGSRETDAMVAEMLAVLPAPKPQKVTVSEAGASVYSASELAAREFPGLDVSLRGAVSIARRLQDPLAELVKIEPKAIGVGQYQHDVNQSALGRSLDAVVEDAVNAVGVELNTASAPLLARVSGLGGTLAEAIVAHRDTHGPFASRKDLLKVARLGPRAFEQAAGFLRIQGGAEPLDASGVHPEAYALARRIVKTTGRDVASLMRAPEALRSLDPRDFTDETFGLPTVQDILRELEKPGRDPRPAFRTATFADGVNTLSDLKPGMSLEGTVTNVAAFGAFVDIGVHQDGLVHVSQLADRFIKDPHEVVKAGDVVRVRVVEVDMARKRIALTMRSDQPAVQSAAPTNEKRAGPGAKPAQSAARPKPAAPVREELGGLGAALRDALRKS